MKANVPKIKAPKGYTFKVDKNYYGEIVVGLYVNGRQIGRVRLYKVWKKKAYETHSSLDQSYRGKGLGALMYARAIQYGLERGYKVQSSGGPAGYAQRVWDGKTLKKYFKIEKVIRLEATCPLWRASAKPSKTVAKSTKITKVVKKTKLAKK